MTTITTPRRGATPSEGSDDLGPDTFPEAQATAPSTAVGEATADDLMNRVVQGAHETIDRVAERAAPHVHRLQTGVTLASDRLQARAGQLRDLGDELTETVRGNVRENPIAAVATALALGMLIGRLSR